MKNKKIIFAATASLIVGTVSAQSQLEREVDVTRAYEPSVQNSLKLHLMPDMSDTTQVRPEFNYEITPRPLVYGFGVNPLNPARIAAIEDKQQLPFYSKLGFGYPTQSVADIRYAKPLNKQVTAGVYATHYGRWAKIENDMEIKEKSTASDNHAGGFIGFQPGEDLKLQLDLGYDYRNVTRYGYYRENVSPSYFDLSDDAMKQHFHNLKARFSLYAKPGRRTQIDFGVGIDYFMDRFKYDQFRTDIDLSVGFGAGYNGVVTIGGDAFLTSGSNNLNGYDNRIARMELAYGYEDDGLRFRLGAGFGYNQTVSDAVKLDTSRFEFMPQLILEKDLAEGRLTPFLHLQSRITDNSYGEMTKRNPYLYSGQIALNTLHYNGRAGIKGVLGGTFKYQVYGGYAILKNAAFWANAYSGYNTPANGATEPFYLNEGNVFTVLTDDLNYFEAGVEIQANILNAVTLTGGFHYYGYSPDTFDEAWGMPEITANFGVTYNHRNRLYLNAGLEYIGERQMYSRLAAGWQNTVVGQANLTFGVDYFLNKQFGVFVQLNNLLNHDIYYFNRYPELGINGMAGVKISF